MNLEQGRVTDHKVYPGGQRELRLEAGRIAAAVRPGQFVYMRVPMFETAVLRRPFSVFKADAKTVSILYECVGLGTRAMTHIKPGDAVSLIGPLGNGFPVPGNDVLPVLVAGGYGVAPLHFLATRLTVKGKAFIGGASTPDILCAEEFRQMGWDVSVATEDGSTGRKGLVTESLDDWPADGPGGVKPEFFVCGPDKMMRAVSERAARIGARAWVSLDKHMGCGVGACLACVHKIKDDDGAVRWVRTCHDGPVFEASRVVW